MLISAFKRQVNFDSLEHKSVNHPKSKEMDMF